MANDDFVELSSVGAAIARERPLAIILTSRFGWCRLPADVLLPQQLSSAQPSSAQSQCQRRRTFNYQAAGDGDRSKSRKVEAEEVEALPFNYAREAWPAAIAPITPYHTSDAPPLKYPAKKQPSQPLTSRPLTTFWPAPVVVAVVCGQSYCEMWHGEKVKRRLARQQKR